MNDQEMKGKVCIITGASGGIGRETALGLARRGATLGLICRDRARGEAVASEIRALRADAEVTLFLADLSSQAAIRQVAGEVLARFPRIDVLINNAGALNLQRRTTVDGLEQTFATNHLGYFLLTELLLPALKLAAPARIVNVASEAHRRGHINFADLQGAQRYAGWGAYGQSKLANILFTRELARRLQGTGVTANSLHPGVVGTGFGSNNRWFAYLMKIGRFLLITPEQGAQTSLFLATSPSVANVSGKYFDKSKERRPTREAEDDAVAQRLWDESAKLVGL